MRRASRAASRAARSTAPSAQAVAAPRVGTADAGHAREQTLELNESLRYATSTRNSEAGTDSRPDLQLLARHQVRQHGDAERKKSLAEGILYGSLDIVKERTGDDPLKVFKKAVENAKPSLEVKSRRVGGSNTEEFSGRVEQLLRHT